MADKQAIRLKMHEMTILMTLISIIFFLEGEGGWGACSHIPWKLVPVALSQIDMTSIWGSQTWGLRSSVARN